MYGTSMSQPNIRVMSGQILVQHLQICLLSRTWHDDKTLSTSTRLGDTFMFYLCIYRVRNAKANPYRFSLVQIHQKQMRGK